MTDTTTTAHGAPMVRVEISDAALQAMVDNVRAVILARRAQDSAMTKANGQPSSKGMADAYGAVAALGACFEALGQWHRFPPMLYFAGLRGEDPWAKPCNIAKVAQPGDQPTN